MRLPGIGAAALALALSGGLSAPGLAATGGSTIPGKGIYKSKCLICHPNSPQDNRSPQYKARSDAVPLWTLYSEDEGWRRSQVGLGQWNDRKMAHWLRYPKEMKPGTPMVEVPMSAQERQEVIKYIKHLGRAYGQ